MSSTRIGDVPLRSGGTLRYAIVKPARVLIDSVIAKHTIREVMGS